MEPYKIFIVEDDPWYGEILEYHLTRNPDFLITRFTTGKECLEQLYQKPDLITIDFTLPDFTGDKLYEKIREQDEQVPVIVISGQEEIPIAVNFLKMGVTDYLIKDDNTKDVLWNAINKARQTGELIKQLETLKEALGQKYSFNSILKGQSEGLQKAFALMDKAAKTNINVSIKGEAGTGKETVAKSIHYNSERCKKNFVALNMAAIPVELMETELFGYEKDVFNNAVTAKAGKFEEANGGTIFLDEITELNLPLQCKLLRVLQEREIMRIGGNDAIELNVRLIVATHKDIYSEVQKGNFREDLYYRIIGLPIELPPLRDRGNDILILAKYFAEEFARENKIEIPHLSESAKDKLVGYNYPGNVRELKVMMELAVVMSDGKEIIAEDISYSSVKGNELFLAEEKTLREYTCEIVKYYFRKYDNDVVTIAEKLDMGKSTIYKMIQQKEIVL